MNHMNHEHILITIFLILAVQILNEVVTAEHEDSHGVLQDLEEFSRLVQILEKAQSNDLNTNWRLPRDTDELKQVESNQDRFFDQLRGWKDKERHVPGSVLQDIQILFSPKQDKVFVKKKMKKSTEGRLEGGDSEADLEKIITNTQVIPCLELDKLVRSGDSRVSDLLLRHPRKVWKCCLDNPCYCRSPQASLKQQQMSPRSLNAEEPLLEVSIQNGRKIHTTREVKETKNQTSTICPQTTTTTTTTTTTIHATTERKITQEKSSAGNILEEKFPAGKSATFPPFPAAIPYPVLVPIAVPYPASPPQSCNATGVLVKKPCKSNRHSACTFIMPDPMVKAAPARTVLSERMVQERDRQMKIRCSKENTTSGRPKYCGKNNPSASITTRNTNTNTIFSERKNMGGFACPGVGLFADDKECTAYYECSKDYLNNLVAVHQTCPEDSVFDPDERRCQNVKEYKVLRLAWQGVMNGQQKQKQKREVHPNAVQICNDVHPVCTARGVFPLPMLCDMCYRCRMVGNSVPVLFQCPQTPTIQKLRKQCAKNAFQNAFKKPESAKEADEANFSCRSPGVFADSLNCHKYFFCERDENAPTGLRAYHVRCPCGGVFDERQKICLKRSTPSRTRCAESRCKEIQECTYFKCPSVGFFPDTRNHKKYFSCELDNVSCGFRTYHLTCPKNRIFDKTLRECVLKNLLREEKMNNLSFRKLLWNGENYGELSQDELDYIYKQSEDTLPGMKRSNQKALALSPGDVETQLNTPIKEALLKRNPIQRKEKTKAVDENDNKTNKQRRRKRRPLTHDVVGLEYGRYIIKDRTQTSGSKERNDARLLDNLIKGKKGNRQRRESGKLRLLELARQWKRRNEKEWAKKRELDLTKTKEKIEKALKIGKSNETDENSTVATSTVENSTDSIGFCKTEPTVDQKKEKQTVISFSPTSTTKTTNTLRTTRTPSTMKTTQTTSTTLKDLIANVTECEPVTTKSAKKRGSTTAITTTETTRLEERYPAPTEEAKNTTKCLSPTQASKFWDGNSVADLLMFKRAFASRRSAKRDAMTQNEDGLNGERAYLLVKGQAYLSLKNSQLGKRNEDKATRQHEDDKEISEEDGWSDGQVGIRSCPSGLVYDTERHLCTRVSQSEVEAFAVKENPMDLQKKRRKRGGNEQNKQNERTVAFTDREKTGPCGESTAVGRMTDGTDKRMYYECEMKDERLVMSRKQCPHNEEFDPTQLECTPSKVDVRREDVSKRERLAKDKIRPDANQEVRIFHVISSRANSGKNKNNRQNEKKMSHVGKNKSKEEEEDDDDDGDDDEEPTNDCTTTTTCRSNNFDLLPLVTPSIPDEDIDDLDYDLDMTTPPPSPPCPPDLAAPAAPYSDDELTGYIMGVLKKAFNSDKTEYSGDYESKLQPNGMK